MRAGGSLCRGRGLGPPGCSHGKQGGVRGLWPHLGEQACFPGSLGQVLSVKGTKSASVHLDPEWGREKKSITRSCPSREKPHTGAAAALPTAATNPAPHKVLLRPREDRSVDRHRSRPLQRLLLIPGLRGPAHPTLAAVVTPELLNYTPVMWALPGPVSTLGQRGPCHPSPCMLMNAVCPAPSMLCHSSKRDKGRTLGLVLVTHHGSSPGVGATRILTGREWGQSGEGACGGDAEASLRRCLPCAAPERGGLCVR